MALNNYQYDTIIHNYDVTRFNNRHTQEARLQYVYENVEGYKELEESTISVSLDMGKKKINGDENAIEELHALLEDLKEMKRSLLKGAGLGEDYLDPIYTCPDCKDTGFINHKKCHCFRKQEIDILYNQSNIRDFLAKNNFNNLSHDYFEGENLNRFTKAEKVCHNMVDNFGEEPMNLLLFGTVGTGKSFLSGCVAHELIEKGYSVIYYSSIGMFEQLSQKTFDKNSKEELYNLCDCLYNCDLLIIDDLGTEIPSSFVSSQLFSCINERNLKGKSTIISTNLSLEEIRDRYSDRVFSRLVSSYHVLKLSGPDIRTLLPNMPRPA